MLNTTGWRAAGAVLVWAVVAGCSGDDEPKGPRAWDSCELTSDQCSCVIREGGSDVAIPPADSCEGFNCCLLSESDESIAASCTCSDVAGACEDVADRAGMTAVGQCPPPGELLSSRAMCLAAGEECPNRASAELSGCCAGLLCLANEGDEAASCQALGDRDEALAQRCEQATLSASDEVEVAQGEVTTDRGDLPFDRAAFGTSKVGPGGCLTALTIEFSGPTQSDADAGGGDAACTLLMDGFVRNGEWQLRRVVADLESCEGYASEESGSFDVREISEIPFAFSYTGEYCGARAIYDEHCVSGVFDWQLDGELGGLTFEGSRLRARGVICGSSDDVACE